MRVVFIIMSMLTLFACSTKNMPEKDIDFYEVHGKVNHLTIRHYYAEDADGKIVKGEPNRDGEIDQTVTFNKKGYVTEAYFYGEADSLDTKLYRKHDDQNRCLGETGYTADGDKLFEWIWKYDDKGNNTERIQVLEDSTLFVAWHLHYDDKNRLISRKTYRSPDSDLYDSLSWTFDSEGRQIEEWNYGFYGLYGGNKLDYLGKTDLVSHIQSYDGYNNLSYFYDLTYNDHDLLAEAMQYAPDSTLKMTVRFDYDYDDHGNWVRKVQYRDDAPYGIQERTIVYFR